jgi:phage tail sheath gpL-like
MVVAFNQMPSSNRVPGTFVEVDGSNALGIQSPDPHRVLIVGLRLASGTALEAQIKQIVGQLDGDAYFGANSQLAAMTRAFKRVNTTARVYAMAMNEASGGVAAAGSFAFTGTSTKEGSLTARLGDIRVTVLAPLGTTAAQAATALSTAINAAARVPMTSSPTTGTVAVTARHKGTHGNEVTIEIEVIPLGLTVVTTQPASGATDADLNVIVTALDEDKYDTIITGVTNAPNMLVLENEMARRWGPLVKQPGMVIAGKYGTQGALTTYGDARNSQFSCVIGSGLSPTPPWIFAAQAAGRDAQRCDSSNPNRPRNGLTLPDCESPTKANVFDAAQRNLLLFDGVSTYKTDQSGRVSIERLITTYQVNGASQSDATYLAMETQRNLARLYQEVLTLGSKYGDYLLAPDGSTAEPGSPVVTPALFRGEMIALNDSWGKRALTKDAKGFANDLIVEINPLDVERLDVQLAPRLVGGLVTLAVKISFML